MFEDLVKHISDQKAQVDELRGQLMIASEVAIKAYETGTSRLDSVLAEERLQASLDRQALLSQITSLVMAQGESQDARLSKKIEEVQRNVLQSTEAFETSRSKYDEGMNAWNDSEAKLIDGVLKSREILKSRMKEDWLVGY
jgi:kinesin family member 11